MAEEIASDIKAGRLKADDRITEADIHATYGVGRTTARRALAWLRDQGLIYTVAKRGSYVQGPSVR